MSRLLLTIVVLAVLLPGLSAAAETWECGESTAYSTNLAINTDNSSCGSDTTTFGPLAIETDLTPCGFSTATPSNVLVVDTVWSPGTMRKHPVGERVTLSLLPITRTFGDRFYIEALDRSSGIGVMQAMTADPGRLATVTGTIGTQEGEIVLLVPDVTLGDLGESPNSLGMTSSALRLGIGADPTGILARIWGTALSVPDGKTYYVVTDGGYPFTVLPEGVPRPIEGERVILTGIPGMSLVDGEEVRVFRVNGQ